MIAPVSEKTGLRLLELFREHGGNPFILISEHPDFGGAERPVRLGAANFLMKLSNTAQLLQLMEETLKEEAWRGAVWRGPTGRAAGPDPGGEADGPALEDRVAASYGRASPERGVAARPSAAEDAGAGTSTGAGTSRRAGTGAGTRLRHGRETPADIVAEALGGPYADDLRPGGAAARGTHIDLTRASEPVKKAVQYVEEHFPGPLTLRRVADAVHLNASYFSVLFKKETGMTFSEYLTRKRLALAKQLLLGTSLSISEIARMAGYGTTKYFTELFRKREGMTPGKYRERAMRHLLSKKIGILPNDSDLDAYVLMAILLSDKVEEADGGSGRRIRIGGLEMLKRAYLLLLAAAMVFPVGISGATQYALAQGVDTVTFMHLWPSGEARQHNLIVGEIIAEFASEHPDVFVEVEALPNEQYKDKITVLAASNQLPDVGFTWAAGYMTPFVQAGQFAPLDDLLAQDGLRDQFVSGTLQAFAIDGVTYGLPLELNIAPVFYNKKIFARYGLDVPKTYDEFLHVVETLAANGVTPIALGNGERWTGSLWYMYLADRIAGPDVVNDAINGRIPFTHPGLIQAAAEVQRLVRMDAFSLGFNALSNAEAKAEFLTEQAAMWLIGSWELPQFTTDETVSQEFRDSIGFFRFPTVEGGAGKDTGWVGGPGVALFVNANSRVKDKAEAFAKYFVEQWGQRAVAEAGVIPGTIVDSSKVQLPQMYLDVLDELAVATSITLYADVQLSPAAAQVHLNQIQALFGLQVTPEEFARAHDEAIRGGQ